MSHSAFRILANDEPINRNLVIVVNKNGQVSTDTEVLQTLLTTKGDANTGISILRETSPTPSISDEIEQERMEKIEVRRQEYLQEHEGEEIDEEELEKQMQQITGAIESEIPHVTLNVENFYPSDQARKFANDVLHLGGIENPSTLMPIDFNFQRQTIQNDHCYTSFLQNTPEVHKPSKSSDSKSSQGKATKRDMKPTTKVREMHGDAESSDDEEGGLEDDEEYEEEEQSGEEISFSESDDDNDMDFSVNDRFGKKGKKKRKYRKHKQKNSTFKDFLETGEVADINDEGKKKFGKSPKKQPKVPKPLKNTQVKKAPVKTQFVPLTNFVKTQQISVTATSTPIKSKQEIEFVESIVKDLEKSFPEADSSKKLVPIPTIMQMMDTNTSAEVIDQSLANLEQLDAVPGIDEIGDALIAVLGNDAIDELFNQDGLMNFSEPLVTSSTPTSTLPIVSEAATSSLVMPKILNKQAPVKDPIKVVRNGRVITLPAIEAPATRGAKRRAQGDSPNTSISEKVIKTEKSDNDSKNSSRRSSVSGKSSRRQSVAAPADELDDLISDASWASEDDPDRLWCICKQPHNNRFMICCDKCEDWFHGKCVNVTKAMGKEYELMGKEWRCPNCKADPGKKIDPNKKPLNQQKLTKFFAKSQKESTDEDVAKTMCVVCKSKAARDSSIYCSDECIQNHATKHIDSDGSNVKPKEETEKRGNILKDKSGNVIVFDRTTGKILSLHKSPHFTKLAQWLAQNPNFEPVKPGSPQARQLLSRSKSQSQPSTPSTPVPETPSTPTTPAPKPAQSGDDLFSNPVKINTGATPPVVKKPTTPTTTVPVRPIVKPTKSPSVAPSSPVKSSSKLPEKKPVKKEERPSSGSSVKVKAEQERQNVRNILRDTLKTRMSEFDHPDIPKMTDDQIADFAKEIEREMFLFFNKDTRDKYKTKYRSLKFNLSDVKNKTLLEKICARKLTPKQLVELPASALASEELSKWRETENKHTLEIITKSELDALAQNKIVVKTHKGEEIIETKTAAADILVPVDDVESVIAKTVLSVDGRYDLSRSISINTSSNSPLSSPTGQSQSTSKKSDSRDKDHHHHHHKSSSSKHKRHRSRSPKHHHKDRKSRDRSRSKHRREKSRESKKEEKKEVKKDSKEKEVKKAPSKPVDIQPDQQDVDLVGKILDSMGVHLEKPKEVPEVPAPPPVISAEPINEHKLPIEIFSGNIHMIDVANFNVTASIVSGNFDDIISVIPSNLDCVGRIEPNTVWDYLEKVKKFPGKELCILRFASDDESGYFNFFTYLHTRQRYGVIKTGSSKIKDFYLVPIEASRPLPKVLLPICGPGFIEGEEHKPDLLLGVMLKILPEVKTKKPQVQQKKVSKPSTSTRPPVVIEHPIHVIPKKSSKLTMGLPEFSKTGELQTSSKKSPFEETDDGDEPYTPFDDDEEFPASTSAGVKPQVSEDLESQMELINREIEQRQMEIQSLAQQKAMEINEEQASRIYENISVPANLSEILSTISSRDAKPMEIDDGDDEEEYVPAPMAGYTASSYSAAQPVPIANAMMDIDERIAIFPAAPPAPIIIDDQPSRLSNMTTADLMKLVPDDAFEAPPAPKISGSAIPGLDNDDDFEMN